MAAQGGQEPISRARLSSQALNALLPSGNVIAPYQSSDQLWAQTLATPHTSAQQHTTASRFRHPPVAPYGDDLSPIPRYSRGSGTPRQSMASSSAENVIASARLLSPWPEPEQRSPGRATASRRNVYVHSHTRDISTPHVPLAETPLFSWPPQPTTNRVDMKALEYVGSVDNNLMCPICYCPFDEPRKLPCEHYFCHKCIMQSLQSQPSSAQSCPACRARTSQMDITCASRIIEQMIGNLRIKCPLQEDGCKEELTRGSVQDHLDRYCAFSEVKCPIRSCHLFVQRKETAKNRCLHQMTSCKDCNISLIEKDVEAHQNKHCSNQMTRCPDCNKEIKRAELEPHIEDCPQAIFPCLASAHGCDFVGRRSALDTHMPKCTLAKLTPFLKQQSELLQAHETALKHLQHKNAILEASFQTIQETLSPVSNMVDPPSSSTPTTAGGPFDSTAHHLLSLHESLRDEVSRVSTTVSELDAKATMMVMNESLRIKDELSHANAAIGGIRHQLHWLVSGRLQNEQRMAMVRAQAASHGSPPSTSAGSSSQGSGAGSSPGVRLPVRSVSDSARQETKL